MTVHNHGRRRFLGLASGALAALPLARVARADSAVQIIPQGDRMAVLAGAGGNVTLLRGDKGPLLVDGGSAEHSSALLRAVASVAGPRPVATLFNTHWHPEQTGSNPAIGRSGARILAHENTRLWLSTRIDSPWMGRHFDPLPPVARPNDTFYTQGSLSHGAEHVDYGYLLQAHTDGDIWVYFRDSNVLAVGDLMAPNRYPISDYVTLGWIGGMVAANKALLDLANEATVIVGGQGPVQSRADLQQQYDMLQVLRDRLYVLLKKGYGADEMLAARPAQEFEARCGSPELFVRCAVKGMSVHARQISPIV